MKAIAQRRFGGPDVLEWIELPEPPVGPNTVLIRARAAAVNPVDYKVRDGGMDGLIPTHFPLVPGFDVAGVVERVGPAVVDFRPGDEVIADNKQDHLQHGSYAQLVPVPDRAVARRPTGSSWAASAALPLAGMTAYQCLRALDVGPGETVLVHAASGGVGRMAVQIARILGAEVIGTASERNHDLLRELGATPVRYGAGLVERVRALRPEGGDRPVDAVVDFTGGQALEDSPALLRAPGRIASIVEPDRVCELGGRYVFVKPDAAQLTQLVGWVEQGRLRVDVGKELPLRDAAEAHQLIQDGGVDGKIVLIIPE